MNRKISLGKALAIILIAVAATVAITMSVSIKIYNNLIKELPNRVNMYSSLSEMDEVVRKEFYGDIDTSKLNSSIAQGFIAGLGDESSFYLTPTEYVEHYNRERGKMSGIGISHTLNTQTGYLHVTGVAPNSPAEAAGLKSGDEIIEIGEDKVTTANYEKLSKNLVGEKMSSINLTYKRDGDKKTISVVMGYSLTTVSYRMLGSTAIVTINAFYENTVSQFSDIITTLQKNGVKGIIF
ncbi:MAG: PDZ domain-containing protein, partial [Oscillospiraceae bacterium]